MIVILLICCYFIAFVHSFQIRNHVSLFTKRKLAMISKQTEKYFKSTEKLINDNQIFGAGGQSSLNALQGMDDIWNKLKNGGWKQPAPPIVFTHKQNYNSGKDSNSDKDNGSDNNSNRNKNNSVQYDVIVCGGTLGIFYAVALQMLGYNVCIIERGKIAGRVQEWNISENELKILIKLKLLTLSEYEQIKSIEFNPNRVGFRLDTSPSASSNGYELYVQNILNLGQCV